MSIREPSQTELREFYALYPRDAVAAAREPTIKPLRLTNKHLDDLTATMGVIDAQSGSERVRRSLSEAAEYFTSSLWLQEAPALSKVERELRQIATSARKLSRLVLNDPSNTHQMTYAIRGWLHMAADEYGARVGRPPEIDRYAIPWNYWSACKLPSILQSIDLLEHLAELAALQVRRELAGKSKGSAFGAAKREAMRVLVHRLALAWLHAKGTPPGDGTDAYNKGKASGPFIRFAHRFISILRKVVTEEQRRYLPTIDDELSVTPDMIRAHLRVFRFRLLPREEREVRMVKSGRKKT
jgi:hypothetical protein